MTKWGLSQKCNDIQIFINVIHHINTIKNKGKIQLSQWTQGFWKFRKE